MTLNGVMALVLRYFTEFVSSWAPSKLHSSQLPSITLSRQNTLLLSYRLSTPKGWNAELA